jgi:mRNA degradation ribonuclease J1/J2
VPGAYGFVINTSQGTVVYTGDFRTHCAKPQMTRDFVVKAKEAEPAAIVTEAKNMTGASISSEKEVENKLNCIVSEGGALCLQSLLTPILTG